MCSREIGADPEPGLTSALADLLTAVEKEPISPRLRDLAGRLDAALGAARLCRDASGQAGLPGIPGWPTTAD